jgi:hypothetical protein
VAKSINEINENINNENGVRHRQRKANQKRGGVASMASEMKIISVIMA